MTKKKTAKPKQINYRYQIPNDFRFHLNVKYDRMENGCRTYKCDVACRCSTIQNDRIENFDYISVVNPIIHNNTNHSKQLKDIEIRDYFLERFCSRLNEHDFEIKISPGYYGEELDSVQFSHNLESQLQELIDKLNQEEVDIQQLAEECLIREYGYLLPILENKSWKFETIPFTSIVSTPMDHGYSKLNREQIEKYKQHPEMLAVVLLQLSPGKYRLIDGNHRYTAAKELKLNEIKALIACL